jgi:hypothetical protein
VNDEFEMIYKKRSCPNFKVLSQYSSGALRIFTNNPSVQPLSRPKI